MLIINPMVPANFTVKPESGAHFALGVRRPGTDSGACDHLLPTNPTLSRHC
jgi:hypothetical protein